MAGAEGGGVVNEPSNPAWDVTDWPPLLQRIATIIGPELTLTLADRCGGLDNVYIPHNASGNSGHLWASVVGQEHFARICAELGGERVHLPRGAFVELRKRRILELAEKGGLSRRQIALQCRVGERYVRRVLNGLSFAEPADPRQGKLF